MYFYKLSRGPKWGHGSHRVAMDFKPRKGFGPMRFNFELSPYYHIGRLPTKVSHNTHTPYKTFEKYKR
jgi:hypothetical protein